MTDQYSILFKQEQAHDDAIWSVAWGTNKKENSETVVTGSLDDLVKVWKWCDERLDLERSLEGHQCLWTSATRCPSLRPDHQYFDIATGKLLHTLGGHAMPIRSLIFSPDSQLLVTASDDSYIKIYDVQHANLDGTKKIQINILQSDNDGKDRGWDLEGWPCQSRASSTFENSGRNISQLAVVSIHLGKHAASGRLM
uniref:Superkiller complex protein 8 n=2 Tax=Canis lupus familiaris TaxID=9615 RepID=A0A8C0TPA3_CANLF